MTALSVIGLWGTFRGAAEKANAISRRTAFHDPKGIETSVL